MRSFGLLLALLLSPLHAGGAQTIDGFLTDGAGETPVPGAIVALLGTAGIPLAQVLSDSTGRFELRAPRAGPYRVRATLPGSATTLSPVLHLGPDERRPYVLAVVQQLVRIEGITVLGRSACARPGASASAMARCRVRAAASAR